MKSVLLACALVALAACRTTPEAAPAAAPAAVTHEVPPDEAHHTNIQPMLASADGAARSFDHQPQPGERAICPVSDEAFRVTAETKTVEHKGRWYAFCCDDCIPDFLKNPDQFATK